MRISKLLPGEKGGWLCALEDGATLTVGENEVISFGLYAGMELDGETWQALENAVRLSQVMERALRLLAARPLSRRELIQKLKTRCGESEAEQAADWLEGFGYLNDEAYANTLAEQYAAKGYGAAKIRDEFYRRGVPRDYWDGALERMEGPEDFIDSFLRHKLNGETPDPKTLKRVSDALARRGYRWEDIKAGLRRYGAGLAED